MTVAQQSDVETSLMRPLSETEQEYADALLGRVEAQLRTRIPDLVDRAGSDDHFRSLVVQVESEALARVYRASASGGGIYSSESEDGYSYSLNFKVASGLLDILDEEWSRLLGYGGGYKSVALESDGYARRRWRRYPDPAHWFQYGWGGGDQIAERVI